MSILVCQTCNLTWSPSQVLLGVDEPQCPVCWYRAQLATVTRERDEWQDRHATAQFRASDAEDDLAAERERAERAEAALQQARELLLSQSATRHPVFGIYGEARPCACVNCEDIRAFLAPEPPTREGTRTYCDACVEKGYTATLQPAIVPRTSCAVCGEPFAATTAAAPQGEPALFKNACPSCSHFSAMDGSGGHRCMDCECRDDYHRLSGGPTPTGGTPGREG